MARYRLDYFFSTSKLAKPAFLLITTFLLITVGSVLLCIASGESLSVTMWLVSRTSSLHHMVA